MADRRHTVERTKFAYANLLTATAYGEDNASGHNGSAVDTQPVVQESTADVEVFRQH